MRNQDGFVRRWLKAEFSEKNQRSRYPFAFHESPARAARFMLSDPHLPTDFYTLDDMRRYVKNVHPRHDRIDFENAVGSASWLWKRFQKWKQKKGLKA